MLSHMLEAVSDIVDVVGPELLNLEQLGQAFGRFKHVLDSSKQRRHERLQRRQAEDFDQDEAEAIEVPSVPSFTPSSSPRPHTHTLPHCCALWREGAEAIKTRLPTGPPALKLSIISCGGPHRNPWPGRVTKGTPPLPVVPVLS